MIGQSSIIRSREPQWLSISYSWNVWYDVKD